MNAQDISPDLTGVRLLRLPAVQALVPLSSPTIWRLRQRGEFPEPIQISPGTVAWLQTDIEAWIRRRANRTPEQHEVERG